MEKVLEKNREKKFEKIMKFKKIDKRIIKQFTEKNYKKFRKKITNNFQFPRVRDPSSYMAEWLAPQTKITRLQVRFQFDGAGVVLNTHSQQAWKNSHDLNNCDVPRFNFICPEVALIVDSDSDRRTGRTDPGRY